MSKYSSGFVHLLLILVTVILLILFLVPLPYYQKTPVLCKTEAPCPSVGWNLHVPIWKQIFRSVKEIPNGTPPLKESSSISIEDWKTYKNDEYGFEFKYPKYLDIEIEGQDRFSFMLSITPNTNPRTSEHFEIALVISFDNKLLTDILDCKQDAGTEGVGKTIDNEDPEFTVFNELITVGGIEGCIQKMTTDKKLTYNVLFKNNNDFYTMQFVTDSSINAPYNLVDQVLSTFKFIQTSREP